MDVQKLMNAVGDSWRDDRAQYHLTLGGLIKALSVLPLELPVEGNDGTSPGALASYRGYYSDLAFRPINDKVTVKNLSAVCKNAINTKFTGYKGGDFLMGEDTPLWIAAYGISSGLAVMDIRREAEKMVLVLKRIY